MALLAVLVLYTGPLLLDKLLTSLHTLAAELRRDFRDRNDQLKQQVESLAKIVEQQGATLAELVRRLPPSSTL